MHIKLITLSLNQYKMKILLLAGLVVAASASFEFDSKKWQHFKGKCPDVMYNYLEEAYVQKKSLKQVAEAEIKKNTLRLKHAKNYINPVEEQTRFSIFQEKLRQIEEHNALYERGLKSHKLGITKFADMTHEEFVSTLTLQKSTKPKIHTTKEFQLKDGVSVPDFVDWREQGAITEIKDQGQCGSCWAFSLTGSIEAAYKLKSYQLVSLSEQQLVDCTTDVNFGCSGGFLEQNFPYVEQYGLVSEESYPYEAVNGTCRYNASSVITKVSSYVTIFKDEEVLKQAVGTVGPVSVAIDATYLDLYDSGILDDDFCSPEGLNHGVLVVGYGTLNRKDYWIVKNSWGTDWGEKGFFRMQRGINQCGISEDTTYPEIE